MNDTGQRTPRHSLSLLLALVVAAVGLLGAAYFATQGLDQVRVDTAVEAVAQGEPGCVTSAVFTGPDGVERAVDVRVYKANCLDRDPGDTLTVFYDSNDPSVTAARQSWWWAFLGAAAGLAFAGVGVRGLVLNAAAVRRERTRR